MDKPVYDTFQHSSLRVFLHFDPTAPRLFPALFCVVAYKLFPALEKCDQAAADFLVIQRLHDTGDFGKAIPSGAENA